MEEPQKIDRRSTRLHHPTKVVTEVFAVLYVLWFHCIRSQPASKQLSARRVERHLKRLLGRCRAPAYSTITRALREMPAREMDLSLEVRRAIAKAERTYDRYAPHSNFRLEVDSFPFDQALLRAKGIDFIVSDEDRAILPNCHGMLAIDVASRFLPLGRLLSTRPKVDDTLSFLAAVMLPQKAGLGFHGRCRPQYVRLDLGPENEYDRVRPPLERCGVVVEITKEARPKQKAHIERLHRSIAGLVVFGAEDILIGQIDRRPVRYVVFSTLAARFVEAVTKYNHRYHRGIRNTPWKEYSRKLSRTHESTYDPRKIIDALWVEKVLSVSHSEIRVGGERYEHAELTAHEKVKARVFFADTTRRVEVFDLDGDLIITLCPGTYDPYENLLEEGSC